MTLNPLAVAVHDEIRGAGGGGGSGQPRTPIEAPDTLRSVAYARILDGISEGEIYGFADQDHPLRCVYFNETPCENQDSTLNFKNFHVTSRVGTQTQDPIRAFDGVENEIGVGVELTASVPYTRSITNLNLSAVRVRISLPSGLSQSNTTNGDLQGYNVAYKIQLAIDGGAYADVINASFSGKASSKFERGHRVDLPPATVGWSLRVVRLTADTAAPNINDTTFIESIAEIIDVKLRMPMTATVGVIIDSQQFNNIPTRAYRMKGRLIRVPSNYNAETRIYTGIWDGTFQTVYSNNPAWVFYDLATNIRYGLGHRVPEALVNKWALYKIAQYCDELVDDGKGGQEPRFTANIYLQTQEEAARVMQNLATMFRGIMYIAGGAIYAVGDMPEDVVYTYTPSNVIDGKFAYSGSSRAARHTVALVSWSDMNDMGRAKVEYIEDEDGIQLYGINPTEVIAIGCTSQGQARRLGKYILTTERYETDTIAFQVGLDGTIPAPGKIVMIADPLRAGRRTGGRVKTATLGSVTLDKIPVIAPGDDLTVTLPNGVPETRVVDTIVGAVVTVTANFSQVPVSQGTWIVETTTLKAQRYRVLGVKENEDSLGFTINGVQHVEGKYAYVEQDIIIEEPPITEGIGNRFQAPVTALTLDSYERAGEVIASTAVQATWLAPVGAVAFKIEWKVNNNTWTPPQTVYTNTAELLNTFPGPHYARVTAISAIGAMSPSVTSAVLDVADQLMYPGFVDTLNAAIDNALLTAENAQATADGNIDVFYQDNPPVIGPGAGEAKVGDIWYDTNDGYHAWRAFGGVWVDAQDDAIAQAIAAATTAQATADGKVKTYFASTAPIHNPPTVVLNLGDLWFNTTVGVRKLFRWNGSNWNDIVSDITMDQLAGLGVNIMPDEYSYLDSATLPDHRIVTLSMVVTRDPTVRYIGPASWKMVTSSGAQFMYMSLNGDPNIPVTPNKKYLVSFYVRSPTASYSGSVYVWDNTTHHGNYNFTTSATPNTWTRITIPANLTASNATKLALRFDMPTAGTLHIDGLMPEYQLGTQTFPSPYGRGSGSGLALLALARAATAQATADGATVIYRQSSAPSFPPAAIGDYWIDTDDTSYWYSTNGITWTTVTDPRILTALADAAAAQATANGRIKTWYQESTPTAATVGDFWYKASVGILYRWDGSLWVNTADNTNAVAMPSVFNPGFEQDFLSWTDVWGAGLTGWSIQTPGLTGAKYMQKYLGVNGTSGIFNDAKFPVQPGQAIICRLGVISQSIPINATQGVSIGLAFYNSAGTNIDNTNWAVAPDINASFADAAWKTYNKAVLAPTGAAYARACLVVWGYTGVGIWSFDSVQVFPADDITAGVNLLNNSELANGLANWTVTSGAIVKEGTNYHWSCTAAGSGVQSYFYNSSPGMAGRVTAGEIYSAQIEVKTTGLASPNGSCTLRVQYCNASDVLIEERYNNVTITHANQPTEWTRLTLENFKAPAGTVNTYFVFMATGTFTTCRVRKPKFEKGARCTAYTPSVESNWGTELGTAGSGVRMGDARNFIQSQVNSFGAVRSTAALTAYHTLGGLKYIDVNTHIAYWGGSSATYNAVSSAATGLTAGQSYVVYCDDPGFGGGTKTWAVSTTPAAQMQLGDGKYVAGVVEVPVTSGGSGSGGGGGGGSPGGYCLDYETAMLSDGGYVRNLCVGDYVECWNGDPDNPQIELHPVLNMDVGQEWCYSLMTENGEWIDQSESTKMILRDGREVTTLHMTGEEVLTNRDGALTWETVTDVIGLGLRTVVKMNLGDRMYFARSTLKGATIATHNLKWNP